VSSLDVLIVGGGMYVAGRGSETPGTIGPALLEARRTGLVGRITVATTSEQTAQDVKMRLSAIAKDMGVDEAVAAFPAAGSDKTAYLTAIEASKPDVAVVVVPDHLHADICEAICDRGIHCLVVKPMAPDTASATRMVAAAERNNVYGMVEFHKRWDDANMLMRDAVRSGDIGTPLYAVVEYSQQKHIPRDVFRGWAEQTSVFQYIGVHYVDLLQFVTSFTPVRVTAWGQKEYLAAQGIDTWDAMQVVIEWRRPDGGLFVSTHISNWIDPDETSSLSDQKINFVGSAGRYQSDQKNRGVELVRDGIGVRDINPYFSTRFINHDTGKKRFGGYGIDSVLTFLNDVSALRMGESQLQDLVEQRPSFQACLQSTAVIEAAHKSLLAGNIPVEISQ